MYNNKHVLLIAGGGTLGGYTAKELMRLGVCVDVICLENQASNQECLRFYQGNADFDFLSDFLKDKYYSGIVNYIHYVDVDEYKPIHKLLSAHTEHLIFLSSYRIYADLEHPITENAPTLYDTLTDKDFFENEKYAVSKSKAEQFLRSESNTKNWTIVRPVISFSDRRLDLVCCSGRDVIKCAKEDKPILLPKESKNLTAGLDWAGNSGKMIANLLFKEKTFGEAYTISSAQNLTWGEVADIYAEFLGVKVNWVELKTYIAQNERVQCDPWFLRYDRLFDRKIDNRKVLEATGLRKEDFVSIRDGIKYELDKILNKEGN